MSTTKPKKRTMEQRRAVFCIDHGHPRIAHMCFGEQTCARCGERVGDTLMGRGVGEDHVIIGHDCDICRANAAALRPDEMEMLPDDVAAEVARLRSAATPTTGGDQ